MKAIKFHSMTQILMLFISFRLVITYSEWYSLTSRWSKK